MSYVVVAFGGPADQWCPLSHCPQHAHGPYASREQAEQVVEQMPGWMHPHILDVVDEPDACAPRPVP